MITLKTGKAWCVYAHYDKDDLFYIGKGISSRPFLQASRNRLWMLKTSEIPEYTVKIIKWFSSSKEAEFFEDEQIRKLKPSCNIQLVNAKISKKEADEIAKNVIPRKPVKICKRTANAIRKHGYARIAKALGLSGRQTVYSWYLTQQVPDVHIDKLSDFLGYRIK